MRKITESSKDILKLLVEEAVRIGDLHFSFSNGYIMKELNIEDENYFQICIHYLNGAGYIITHRDDVNSDIRQVEIKAKAIDLIEAD